MTGMTTPQPPPEALMIERVRKSRRPPMSIREAARRAGMSDTRWRQIAAGYQIVSKGVRIPVTAPPETIARMALAVDADDQQLLDAGRSDAIYAYFEQMIGFDYVAPKPRPDLQHLTNDELLAELGARLAALETGQRHAQEVAQPQQGQGSAESGSARRTGAPKSQAARSVGSSQRYSSDGVTITPGIEAAVDQIKADVAARQELHPKATGE